MIGGDLPNSRRISSIVHRDRSIGNRDVTMQLMQWGQFIDHDLTATATSRGFNHSVPMCCDPLGKKLPEEFTVSLYFLCPNISALLLLRR